MVKMDTQNLVSKQMAIDAAIEAVDSWDGRCSIGRQKRIENYINKLPPVQPEILACGEGELNVQSESHWIPVKERLPKKSGTYTVTDHKGDVVRFIFIVGSDSSRKYWYRCAKAWMPLPEPYKESGGMIRMTRSFSVWCLKFHKDIYSLLRFGHTELLTEKMYQEYLDWVQTDEGRQYLKGGSKYKAEGSEE